ncbi:MAG: hypothetical protein HKN41_10065 [Ilumatobacter sp.]|nr:hypothetical protein [Ilumatobacter sp.]
MIRRATIVAVAASIALAACGGSDPDPVASPATAAPTSPATSAASDAPTSESSGAVVPAALDFSAPLLGGGSIELGALAGRPVLLWFWAPW